MTDLTNTAYLVTFDNGDEEFMSSNLPWERLAPLLEDISRSPRVVSVEVL